MIWNPWRGCKKYSSGCKYCYIHKGDIKRGVDTSNIVITKDFNKPIEKLKDGSYKIKSGLVYTCFSSDFFIEEMDSYRMECFSMIKERSDLDFLFLTKRIDRFNDVIPSDWESGYDNVIVCCTVEDRESVEYRLKIFKDLPIKHKCITIQPLLEEISIIDYLDGIELVVVGGESDYNGRVLDYDWVLKIREECIKKNVGFEFRQCGTHFKKDGKLYNIATKDLCKQARLANINYNGEKING